MRLKYLVITIISIMVLQACSSSSNAPRAVETNPATNPGGGVVTAVITARFAPADGILPFPINLLLVGTTDLTLNPPTDDPTNFGDPAVALSALDGFSPIAPWGMPFSANVAPSSVTSGNSVRVFEVALTGPGGGVTGITAELQAGVDYVAVANGAGIGIVPLKALKQITSYMAVITNGVTDDAGNAATPDQTYFITKRTSPLVDANGNSTDPLLPNTTAQALEPLRQLTNSQEFAASSAGINPADIVLSFVMTTQSITPVMSAVYAQSGPGASTLAPTGLTTSAVGGAGIADIFIGIQSSPYYLEAPSAANPTAPLNRFWKAAPGAYVAPFDAFGLDPTSTNLTFANPFPVATGVQTYPVIMTLPNASSGQTKPASGWPIVIYQHGITRNRSDMLAIADTLASIGYAVIAQDLPLHGITDAINPFYVEGTPFGPVANERTFDLDFANNGDDENNTEPGPDGVIDDSGSYFINLSNLLVSRDASRQGVADLFTLTATIPTIDYDGDGVPDFDGSRIAFVSHSLGTNIGVPFLAIEENVTTAVLSAGGGGTARLLDGSPTFGPVIRAGLAAVGVVSGTPTYDQFMVVAQTVIDGGDPLNFAPIAGARNNILFHEVLGDLVIPNSVLGSPLSGTEPLIAAMGLPSISSTTTVATGLDGAVRFTAGDHSSLLRPTASLAATVEMQMQMASMITTVGTTVVVTDTSVVQQ
ncbi:MAG: Ig-like domain-containing protein [Proteobacteria bacterium]|nr:Ig-like domain-containing protein [Pseudomonadota bacterium]